MSLSLNFLVQLKILCEKEIAKREQDHPEAGVTEALSVLRSGNNRTKRSDTSICVSSLPKGNVKEIPKKGNNTRNLKTKSYFCSKCDYHTESQSDYINHTESCAHTRKTHCFLCFESCLAADLDDHVRSVHLTPDFFRRGEDGSYNCLKCNVSCNFFSKFKIHLTTMIHKGLELCKACDLVLPSNEMKLHRTEFHSKQGEVYICKICGSRFPTKESHDRHVASVHGQNPQMKCEECGKLFKRQDNYKRHLATHSDIRCYPCPLCKLSFKVKNTLDAHIKNIHSANRHQCGVCYRGFSDKNDYNNHVLTHQGFTFQCMVCGKGYRTYHRREDHYKTHLNTRKKQKNNVGVAHHDNLVNESSTQSPRNLKRKAGALESPSDCQMLVDGDGFIRHEIGISDSEENLEDQNPISASKCKKANVRRKSENKSRKLDGRRKLKVSKDTVSEVSSVDEECCNSINSEKDSNLITKSGASRLLNSGKHSPVDVSLLDRSASKTAKLSDYLPKKDCGGIGQAIAYPVGPLRQCEDFSSAGDIMSEKALRLTGPPSFLPPCSTIPQKTLCVDVNNVADSDVESFSSFQPDSLVAGSTLCIDVDSVCQVESNDVLQLEGANTYPAENQCHIVQTEDSNSLHELQNMKFETYNVVSTCSTDGVLAQHTKGETDCGVSLCSNASQNGLPYKKKLAGVGSYSIEREYCDIQTGGSDSVDVLDNLKFEIDYDGVLAHHLKRETDSRVALWNGASQDGPPVKNYLDGVSHPVAFQYF